MTTKALSKEEYLSTLDDKMVDVTNIAEPSVDIWQYVQQLTLEKLVLEYVTENQLVETVYRNQSAGFDHVLLPTGNKDTFVAIIVDLNNLTVTGHYFLDLRAEYGISPES